tara:strand:+ start:83 stop:703 length:621 start_codon:yes stop_codon:yes gene_type:complete
MRTLHELERMLHFDAANAVMCGIFARRGFEHPGLKEVHDALVRDWGLQIVGIRGDMIGPVERDHIVVRLPPNRFGAGALRIVWRPATDGDAGGPAVVADARFEVQRRGVPPGWEVDVAVACDNVTEIVDAIDEWCDDGAPAAEGPSSPDDEADRLQALLRSVEALFAASDEGGGAKAPPRSILDVTEDEIARFLGAQTEAWPVAPR